MPAHIFAGGKAKQDLLMRIGWFALPELSIERRGRELCWRITDMRPGAAALARRMPILGFFFRCGEMVASECCSEWSLGNKRFSAERGSGHGLAGLEPKRQNAFVPSRNVSDHRLIR